MIVTMLTVLMTTTMMPMILVIMTLMILLTIISLISTGNQTREPFSRARCIHADMTVRGLLCASLLLAACQSVPAGAAPSPSTSALHRPGGQSPDPLRLPTSAQERSMMQALATAGMVGTSVTPSKFDWLFGAAAPRSGVFTGSLNGVQVWADVHFLEATVQGITACASRSPAGESLFTVGIKGRPQVLGGGEVTGALSGAGPMYFATGDRLFVMTPDLRLRDALLPALGLSMPSCIWREPETLPVLPWEREVIDALGAQRIEARVISGSKFEAFLGDRRDGRVFIGVPGSTGADVLWLGVPLGEIRMCSSLSSPGFTRWSVTVDRRELPGMEGSQAVYPLVGARFFVLAWDRSSAEALARGLGLSAPPC